MNLYRIIRPYIPDYVSHHGIIGMHWGARNGPPYPLSQSQHNAVVKKGKKKDSDVSRYGRQIDKVRSAVWDNELSTRHGRKQSKLKRAFNDATIRRNTKKLNKAKLDINDVRKSIPDGATKDALRKAGVKFSDRYSKKNGVKPRKLKMSNDENYQIDLENEIIAKSGDSYSKTGGSKNRKAVWRQQKKHPEAIAFLKEREASVVLNDLNYRDTKKARKFLIDNHIIDRD